jgi:lipoprotein signal peptidase
MCVAYVITRSVSKYNIWFYLVLFGGIANLALKLSRKAQIGP